MRRETILSVLLRDAMMTPMMLGVTAIIAPAFTVAWLWLSALFVAAAWLTFVRARDRLLPPRPEADDVAGALRADTPAVVNLLTNDATVTAAGFRATMIDLAARGWLRILPPEDDLEELARVRPAATAYQGDALRPHERLVLQHVLSRFTTDRAVPARYLAVDIRGAWWRRFSGLVVDDAIQAGLIRRRWALTDLLVPGALWAGGLLSWLLARGTGDDEVAVIDSVGVRIIGWTLAVLLIAGVACVARLWLRPPYTHTDDGVTATRRWLAVRERLAASGFGDLAPSAVETGDRRLAYASAMCLAEGAAIELPLAREDHHRAWSTVGGKARLVRITYPVRFGYGTAPFVAIGVGLVTCFVGLRLRSWSSDVARGETFDWVYEQFPSQDWLIADVATAVTFVSFVPILLGLWLAVAGAFDGFNSVERTGAVVRTRRPAEVSPLPRRVQRQLARDRYRVYLAVDDGSSDTITAWKTGERHAVPQGARATVVASPLLGHIRRTSPVGHVLVE
jgi:hypothetical protein